MNRMFYKVSTILLIASTFTTLSAQVHPKEALGRKIFDSFRTNNFKSLYDSSIFSISEENFKFLLQNGQLSYNPDCRVMNYSMGLPKTNEVL